jgi:hypothetical protein
MAFAFCGCHLSDIFVAPNDNGAGSTNDGRPVPSGGGGEANNGNGGVGAGGVQHFTVEVVVSPEGTGTVLLDPPGGTYEEGTEVSLTATPSRGFAFVGFDGDLTSSTAQSKLKRTGSADR